jgi:16S rRNA (guanine527-N7)-methyltransferase
VNALWVQLASRGGVTLTEPQAQRLEQYLDLLFVANERMNLTRITDRAAAELHHVGDSLTLLPHLPAEAHSLADVGTGGGVPGIPLAIVRPDVRVTLIESTKKKAAFLTEAIAALELTNVAVLASRAEEVGTSDLRETFEVAVARAVATLDWLVEWCLPLVRKGGMMLAMKGAKVADELPTAKKAIKLLGGSEPVVHPVDLPGTEHHVIVKIHKSSRSHNSFPRDPTMAKGKAIR